VSRRPVAPRAAARRAIERIIDAYAADAGPQTALAFIDALEAVFLLIAEHPGAGSPRFGIELDLPGLRSMRLRRFPHLVFYVERGDSIDVWRVLHGRRDLPGTLAEPDS
jgi:toxin ParE1/3/4